MIVAGDFNCVSHLDYPVHVAKENYGRQIEQSPTHHEMLSRGFIDTWRHVHPKVTKETLGRTWTTVGTDYIYKSNEGFVPQDPGLTHVLNTKGCLLESTMCTPKVTSSSPPHRRSSSITKNTHATQFPEFPSDHAGVLTTFLIR